MPSDTNSRASAWLGLCVARSHARFCMYLARAKSPIWRCEEVDDSGAVRDSASAVVDPEPPTQVAETLQPELTDKPRGVYSNCENLPTCCLPKAKSGVWHCEEYA